MIDLRHISEARCSNAQVKGRIGEVGGRGMTFSLKVSNETPRFLASTAAHLVSPLK